MEAKELHHHLDAHKRWLSTAGADGKRLNLSGQCLADADLRGENLNMPFSSGRTLREHR